MKKDIKSTIRLFYQGGTKAQIDLATNRQEAEVEIKSAKTENRDIKLETVETDVSIEESFAYLKRDYLLFYTITTPVAKPLIALVGANSEIEASKGK